ncbi:hypothetical protein CLCR_04246 [Cladophialophora carrionii]|uniref:Uncharacterized protein n=1 Tax=Cladophialophora carrionii TaxID=86049 RepID=A0A1C1CIK5_9EURO|nr:hypothetical protein CLCR_04246 [Cladophialophora carrionii]
MQNAQHHDQTEQTTPADDVKALESQDGPAPPIVAVPVGAPRGNVDVLLRGKVDHHQHDRDADPAEQGPAQQVQSRPRGVAEAEDLQTEERKQDAQREEPQEDGERRVLQEPARHERRGEHVGEVRCCAGLEKSAPRIYVSLDLSPVARTRHGACVRACLQKQINPKARAPKPGHQVGRNNGDKEGDDREPPLSSRARFTYPQEAQAYLGDGDPFEHGILWSLALAMAMDMALIGQGALDTHELVDAETRLTSPPCRRDGREGPTQQKRRTVPRRGSSALTILKFSQSKGKKACVWENNPICSLDQTSFLGLPATTYCHCSWTPSTTATRG